MIRDYSQSKNYFSNRIDVPKKPPLGGGWVRAFLLDRKPNIIENYFHSNICLGFFGSSKTYLTTGLSSSKKLFCLSHFTVCFYCTQKSPPPPGKRGGENDPNKLLLKYRVKVQFIYTKEPVYL